MSMTNKNTNNFQERPEQQLGRNHFDHSYPHIDTFSMGELVPFFWTETMPNDYWEISSEHFYLPQLWRQPHCVH